jgi:asparagine synthase (glutamine-hydrolysing)
MCGIWASIGWTEDVSARIAGRALSAVQSRGPDGAHTIGLAAPAGYLTLGHARLAIYDRSNDADQPMSRGPLTIVFNGAIYNFLELRSTLEALGHTFYTRSDTEVFVAAWLQWGLAAPAKMDGMFAALIHDARTHSLFLLRDRFGEKPLHIWQQGNRLAIASEIAQFQAAGLLDRPQICEQAARDFLDHGIGERGSYTFYHQVERLGPGRVRRYDLAGAHVILSEEKSLFAPPPKSDPALSDPKSASDAIGHAFSMSVQRRLVADVSVGSCLSGGLDSSMIVREAAKHLSGDVRLDCFCAIFDEKDSSGLDLSEKTFARAAADDPRLKLHELTPADDSIAALLDATLARQGEPFAHSSIVAQHCVFSAAKDAGLKVMLDGQGADELFGGYPGMLGHHLADVFLTRGLKAWHQSVIEFSEDGGDLDAGTLKRATFNALVPEGLRRSLSRARGRWPQLTQITRAEMTFGPTKQHGLDRFESLMRSLQDWASLPSLLRYEDRNAMSFGIETRLPFLSLEMVDLAARIPSKVKAANGWTKAVLRNSAQDYVPDIVVRRRRKLGFVTPQDRWIAGPLKTWTREGIDLGAKAIPGLLYSDRVAAIAAKIGNDPAANAIGFRLACLGHWAHRNGLG